MASFASIRVHLRFACLLGVLLVLSACAPRRPAPNPCPGITMGTTYSIRIAGAKLGPQGLRQLHAEIEGVLAEVNRQMSIYLPDSEISRFNRAGAGEPFAVSADFQQVIRRALDLAEASDGTFDPTVGALVNLWGFGPGSVERRRPAPEEIEAARARVGYRHLSLTPDGQLVKDIPDLQLDLGAIAKGFGVDQVAGLLRRHPCRTFWSRSGAKRWAKASTPTGCPGGWASSGRNSPRWAVRTCKACCI